MNIQNLPKSCIVAITAACATLNCRNFYKDSAPMRAIIINIILICRKDLWSQHYKKTLIPYCLYRLLQAGAMKLARWKEKHLIIINKNLTHCCLSSNASYQRTWGFYRVRVYRRIKITLVWLPWGSVFMSEPCETLKNWTHWGVMGVIKLRHSARDCQNESHLSPVLRAPQYCIFSSGSWCTYRRK